MAFHIVDFASHDRIFGMYVDILANVGIGWIISLYV